MSLGSRLSSLVRTVLRSPAARRTVRRAGRQAVRAVRSRHAGTAVAALADRSSAPPVSLTYAPRRDEDPDPGEVVWAWVPYEEDLSQGKDRPVLVLAEEDASRGGHDGSGPVLIALMMTSRDRAATGEVHTDQHGSTWIDIGTGPWDRQGRDSEVRADRLLRIPPAAVRREGARLPRQRFARVAAAVGDVHGWDG